MKPFILFPYPDTSLHAYLPTPRTVFADIHKGQNSKTVSRESPRGEKSCGQWVGKWLSGWMRGATALGSDAILMKASFCVDQKSAAPTRGDVGVLKIKY